MPEEWFQRTQFHFTPDTYLDEIRREVPDFDTLQHEVGEASAIEGVQRVLDLGAGTGSTSMAVLEHHPSASLSLVDESAEMLAVARAYLDAERVESINVSNLRDELPAGPFDLVVSALAVHHLDGAEKRALFGRVRGRLRPAGRFVLADVVVPDDPADAVTPLTAGYDKPDRADDLLTWLSAAGFASFMRWRSKDLVVIAADVERSPRIGSIRAVCARALALLLLLAAALSGAGCAADLDERGLPPNDFEELADLFDPQLEPLGLTLTRGALIDTRGGRYRESDTGRHLAVYVEPTGGEYTPVDYAEGIVPSAQVFLPEVFRRWSDLKTMDVCQEPLPGVDDRKEPPPVTQLYVSRAEARDLDWDTVTLPDLVAAAEPPRESYRLYLAPEVTSDPSWPAVSQAG